MQEDGIVRKLYNKGKLNVTQEFVKDTSFEVITGSTAYGMSSDASDIDVVAICVEPLDWIFPSFANAVPNFGPAPPKFEVFQEHHIEDNEKEYDVAVYGIVKFFQLAAENNPNMCALLFHPDNCIVHIDNIGKLMKQNRRLFLTRHCFHKYIGYAFSQLKKIKTKNPTESRMELVEKYGFDTKFGSHLVRLVLECQQILTEHDLDIQRNREILKSIRRGEWTLDQLESWFREQEVNLNKLYTESTLRYSPEWDELRRVLCCCLEEKYGSLSAVMRADVDPRILRKFEQIKQIVNS